MKNWGLNPTDVKSQFEKFKKRSRTATDEDVMTRAVLNGIVEKINSTAKQLYCDEKKITPGNIFGFFPQYDDKGKKLNFGVQMDWMVGNLDWLQFSYYSTVYTGNVKGLHRTQLMLSMFQNLDLSFNHVKGVTDKKTSKIIATSPKEAIEILEDRYEIKLSKRVYENYFSLIKVVNKLPKKDRDNIIAIYFKILDSTRADIPDDLQSEWKKRKSELGLTGKFLPKDSKLVENKLVSFNEFLEKEEY
jgi:hypothetical protein